MRNSKYDWKQIITIIIIFFLILFLWNHPLLYPIKLFIVFLHELGHGVSTVLTGGKILGIVIDKYEGGLCLTQGGFTPLIVMSGYIGSIIFGGIILLLSSKTNIDKLISLLIGIIIIYFTIKYMKNAFGFSWGILFGLIMIIFGLLMPTSVNDFILRIFGITSILYSIIDIKEDLITKTIYNSDAFLMSKMIPLPPLIWGIIWMIISLFFAFLFLKYSFKK